MNKPPYPLIVVLAVLVPIGNAAYAAEPAEHAASNIGQLHDSRYETLRTGKSSRAEVQRLLGQPWRAIQYNDLDGPENVIWEYRGHDASGSFRLHLEFDSHGKLTVLAKVADKSTPD